MALAHLFHLLAVEDRKLSIGMVSLYSQTNDILVMFSPFGQIEECRILRAREWLSRGECAVLQRLCPSAPIEPRVPAE